MRRALYIVVSTLVVLIVSASANDAVSSEKINNVSDGVNSTTVATDRSQVLIDLADGSSLLVSLDDREWDLEFDTVSCVDALATSLCVAPVPANKG